MLLTGPPQGVCVVFTCPNHAVDSGTKEYVCHADTQLRCVLLTDIPDTKLLGHEGSEVQSESHMECCFTMHVSDNE